MYGALFNSNNLGTGNYFISSIEVDMPKSNINKYELVKSDGQIVTSKYYGERKIKITGRIIANNFNDMQARLDALKVITIGYEKPLDITIANTSRRYIATVDNFEYKINGYDCRYTLVFTCNSIAMSQNVTSLTFGTYTSNNTSYTNTIDGTYKTSPYIELTINKAIPYWSNKYIQIKNGAINERIRITKDWNFGDKLVIDGYNKTVSIYKTAKTVIDTLDSVTSWTSGHTLSLDTTNKVEGAGCASIVMGTANTETYADKLNFTPYQVLSATSGKVYVPVFIPTPTSGSVSTVRFIIGSDTGLGTNYSYWDVSTQFDGSAIATNAWNYFAFDLSVAATGSSGTADRNSIKSISIRLRSGSNFQLNGWRVDYISLQKPSVVAEAQDYEGTFVNVSTTANSLNVEDELDSRNITITGNYYKRYI